jgi:hypothetical protein
MPLPTIAIPNFAGASTVVNTAASGRQAAVDSSAVALSSEDYAALTSTSPVPVTLPGNWEAIAASQTQTMGGSGAIGDYLSHVTIIPATTSPGAVQIKDGSGAAITIFTGGASSVSNLVPFAIPLGLLSLVGAWQIITNANVSAIAAGKFS